MMIKDEDVLEIIIILTYCDYSVRSCAALTDHQQRRPNAVDPFQRTPMAPQSQLVGLDQESLRRNRPPECTNRSVGELGFEDAANVCECGFQIV